MTADSFGLDAAAALARATAQESRRYKVTPGAGEWYIVRMIGKTDGETLKWLERFKVETYYPQIMQLRPVPRRQLSRAQRNSGLEITKPTLAPLFPRYVFSRFDIGREGWHEIFRTAGIAGMVCEGDLPVRVSDKLLTKIRAQEKNGGVPGNTKAREFFATGDGVTVTDGPFASFPGIVEKGIDVTIEELDPETRIKVAVNIFGRSTPVELEVWQVAKR